MSDVPMSDTYGHPAAPQKEQSLNRRVQQPVSPAVTVGMVEAAIRAWNVAEPEHPILGVSYHRTFAEVITAAINAWWKGDALRVPTNTRSASASTHALED